METRAHRIVRDACLSLPRHIEGSDQIRICCPNPAHDDRSPSAYVYVGLDKKAPTGYVHCFSCGYSEPWNHAARILGLPLIEEGDLKALSKRSAVPIEVRKKLLPTELTYNDLVSELGCGTTIALPMGYNWRGIERSLLVECGVRLSFDIKHRKTVLILPVYVNGKLVGGIRAVEKRTYERTSYLNMRGKWSLQSGLFPYDLAAPRAMELGYILVVEGPRDALRLIQEGIPAVSILGAENWSKAKLMALRSLGVTIILCMDGDDAGVEATNMIWGECVEALGREVAKAGIRVYKLKRETIRYQKIASKKGIDREIKIDPANAPRRAIERLKSWISA